MQRGSVLDMPQYPGDPLTLMEEARAIEALEGAAVLAPR